MGGGDAWVLPPRPACPARGRPFRLHDEGPGAHPVAARTAGLADRAAHHSSPSPGMDAGSAWRNRMNVRRNTLPVVLALLVLAGCSKQTAQNSPGASSDSLLASSPVEQPQGQIQPETNMPPQQQTP